jgi:glycosyltransferase involved in cell wall biosynthesis
MKVVVVSEFYPRRSDPVLGVWAHRQALAAARAGADVHVVVLHRPIPPLAALREGPATAARVLADAVRQPREDELDGLPVRYVRFVSPPRPSSYETWGTWAAAPLAGALRRLRRRFAFDLVHAHNAVPAGEAVRRARLDVPTVVSVHGGDVLHTARRGPRGRAAVERALGAARLTLANSGGIERLAAEHGAGATRVVHLGAEVDDAPRPEGGAPLLVTVGHLVARKRHADVIEALAALAPSHPELRYLVIGDGPERPALEALARRLGVADRVEMRGQLAPHAALVEMRRASLFVMPSTDEALGVAYLEAMGSGVPALAARGEPGPEDIAAAGPGLELVAARDTEALAARIAELLADPARLRGLGDQARRTVAAQFSWERCGRATVDAYRAALA